MFTKSNKVQFQDQQLDDYILEVETLRSNLEEANGDILALRKQLQKGQNYEEIYGNKRLCQTSRNDYEQLVQELEKVKKKYQQIQLDYRATLDEKEELVSDRDYYKNKVQRLNQQISYILTNRSKSQTDTDAPKPIVDIDAVLTENKYLHERITQLQVEKEIVKRTLTKYKVLLDNRGKNETLNNKKGFSDVMTQKQVREYLDINSKTGLKRNSAAELKSLCLGLFEALNDKSIALQHQRRTNQILANRITELEKTLESWCSGEKCIPTFPSQLLIEELLDAASIKSDDKEKLERKPVENSANKINSDSEDETTKSNDNLSVDLNYENGSGDNRSMKKIVLPQELQKLVMEALAEKKAVQ